jgi:hypothetical protein
MKMIKFLILPFIIFIGPSCVHPSSINLQMEQPPAEQLETILTLEWKL